jgi:hypothetical protein
MFINVYYTHGFPRYIANTLSADRESFLWLATYPTPTTLDENAVFAAELEDVIGRHANDIPTMAKGYVVHGAQRVDTPS